MVQILRITAYAVQSRFLFVCLVLLFVFLCVSVAQPL